MRITVHNPTVHKNLELLKLLLKEAEKRAVPQRELFSLFIHRSKGDLFFSAPGKGAGGLEEKEWKRVVVRVEISKTANHIQFEVLEDNHASLKEGDLEPLARRVVQETKKVLNYISHDLERRMAAEDVLRQLPLVAIQLSEEKGKKDLVHEAWHQADRQRAEDLLMVHPVGTFLFRRDIYAAYLEEQLRHALHKPIKCITLTFLEENKKISDRTLVKNDQGWLFYDDDPQLEGPYYSSVNILLETLKDALIMPLIT